ncbi:nuclear transport factor 2 family protein [soil metagenome]
MNTIKNAIYNYFKGLETGNINMILDVFAENAIVHSPLYGDQLATVFYTKLFADTRQSDITLLNIFESIENNYTAAVHFKYHWILADGTPTHFECVDVFKFDENGKVADMTIIYDTAKLRPAFEALSKGND